MKKAIFLLCISALYFRSVAQTPTWSENIACIAYTNCTSCHNPGGVGPFSMVDYSDAYAARFAIKAAVQSQYMPPWPPNESYQTYAHERILTQTQIDLISAWVDGGAPQGNPAAAPTPPVYATGSQLPQLDWSGVMPTYTNNASLDDYRCFIIPTNFNVEKFIQSIEVLPGNRSIVHHVLVYADTANAVYALDANDPGPGYQSFGGTGSNTSKLIAAWVPGSEYITYPNGMGVKLLPNTKIIMQLHYPAGTLGQTDSTRINFQYASGSVREVSLAPILNHITNITPALVIPPNTVKSFTEQYTLPNVFPNLTDYITVLSVAPHMHKVGKSIKSYAILPSNDTIELIDIPNWDFKWQGMYHFRQPMVFPEGTKLKAEAVFDNTSANPNAPNHNAWVYAGEATDEEMMIVYFSYLYAFPGDADIIVDTATVKPTYNGCNFMGLEESGLNELSIQLYPNPSNGESSLVFDADKTGELDIKICDVQGKQWNIFSGNVIAGKQTMPINSGDLPSGSYYVVMTWNNKKYTRPLIISQ